MSVFSRMTVRSLTWRFSLKTQHTDQVIQDILEVRDSNPA